MQNADVVVVGAGLSGLVAARELTHAGLDVRVVEARDRIGGRIHTVADVHGAPIELGAAFVGPHQHAIRQLAEEFELELIPTWDSGVHWGEFAGRHRQWRGSTPRLSSTAMVSAGVALTRLNAMARAVSTAEPWAARRGHSWDSISVGDWLDRRRMGGEARGLLTASLRSIFAADTDDLSLLHVLMCIHSAGGFRKYMRSSGAQQARFVDGASTLCARIADDLEHVPNLTTPVRRIEQTNEGVDVIGEATTFRARFAVVAVPPALLSRISFVPDIPGSQRGVVESASSGTVLKYHLYYSRPFWRTAGYSGKSLTSSELVNATFDHSPTEGCGVLVAFVVGRHAEELLCRPPHDRIDAVLDCLAVRYGPEARETTDTYVHSWSEDAWASGCFAAYLPPGVWTERKTSMRAHHGLVHFAGTETATRYFGAMEGAVTAGRRAAADILADPECVLTEVRRASRGIG